MAQKTIKVGLAPKKTSFYDPQTNTYITLDNKPFTTITFDDALASDQAKLSKIAHALFCQFPALVLYEGKLPDETVAAWKARYDAWGGPQAKKRADQTNAGIVPINAKSVENPEELTLFSEDDLAQADLKAANANALADAQTETSVKADDVVKEDVKEDAKAAGKQGKAANK